LKHRYPIRLLYKVMDRDVFLRLREIRGASTYLSLYAPLGYINGVENLMELFKQENLIAWTKNEEIIINNAWSIIKNEILK